MTWDSTVTQYESAAYLARPGDRRHNFTDYLRDRADEHPEIRYYFENGSWTGPARIPGLDEGHLRTGDNRCYYNAQTSIAPGYDYAEGYAVSAGGAIAHAWLMDGGRPIELSPSLQQMDVDYFGIVFKSGLVRDAMVDRGTADPIVEVAV